MTIGVPIVKCLHRVRRMHKAAQTPLYLARPPSHVPGQWPQPVARGQGWLYVSTWTSMRLAPVRCRMLLHSFLPTDDACSSSSLSTTVIKFSIISDPTRKFSLSRLNSVEYGNCKTTTLLPSTKCTRPLFQGWTGCSGRPSGWHDIVTCQRLVWDTIAARQYQLTKDYPLKAGYNFSTKRCWKPREYPMDCQDPSVHLFQFLTLRHCLSEKGRVCCFC